MHRATHLFLMAAATGSGAASGGLPPTSTTGRSPRASERQTADIFSIRKSPTSLYEDAMHSNTLTDHPITHRTSRDELTYRQRKLTERGMYEQAALAEEEAVQRDHEGKSGAETHEYYWVIACAVLGYLVAHAVVFNYYYPDDLRVSYSPDRGYSDDVAARQENLAAIDELVGVTVMESIFSKRKLILKRKLDGAP